MNIVPRVAGKPRGELHIKRFYLPGVTVACDCPTCGKEALVDLAHEYLPYPHVNQPFDLTMGCGCGSYWCVRIRLRMAVEAVS